MTFNKSPGGDILKSSKRSQQILDIVNFRGFMCSHLGSLSREFLLAETYSHIHTRITLSIWLETLQNVCLQFFDLESWTINWWIDVSYYLGVGYVHSAVSEREHWSTCLIFLSVAFHGRWYHSYTCRLGVQLSTLNSSCRGTTCCSGSLYLLSLLILIFMYRKIVVDTSNYINISRG